MGKVYLDLDGLTKYNEKIVNEISLTASTVDMGMLREYSYENSLTMNPLEAFHDKGWYPILHTKHVDNTKHSLKNAQINFSFSYFNKVDELNNTIGDFIKNILTFKISNNKINDVYLTTSGENQKVINAICHYRDVVYVQLLRKNGFDFCNISIDSPIFNINKFLHLNRIVDTNNSSLSYNNTMTYYGVVNESEISDFHILRFNTTYVDDIKINNGDASTLLLSNGDKAKLSTINGQNLLSGENIVINTDNGNYAPKTHNHGNITSDGTITGATSKVVVTDDSGKITYSDIPADNLNILNVISGDTSIKSFMANDSVTADGPYSFAEGVGTISNEIASHAEGYSTESSANGSHAEGWMTIALGHASHAEGDGTTAYGDYSHAEGSGTTASGESSHAEGYNTYAEGIASHAEGSGTTALGQSSHAEGENTQACVYFSHAEGYSTVAEGIASHAEGYETYANAHYSHAEGYDTHAEGADSHAEGYGSYAIGEDSHAEGTGTISNGNASHAEGNSTQANGDDSHAEGIASVAEGVASHAEGGNTRAIGESSHAEGILTKAEGVASHAEGEGTVANYDYSHACGKYNLYGENEMLFVVGNGEDENNRSNAFMMDNAGNGYFAGNVKINAEFDENGNCVGGTDLSELINNGGGSGDGNYAPMSHASSTSTYGLGTTGEYGHVKISNGDVATTTATNGLAAGMNHSHGNYALSSHTHDYAPKSHAHGNISSAGVIAGAASRVVVTDANGKITSSSTITTTELGYLDGVTGAIQTQLNSKASTVHTHGNISSEGIIAGAVNSVVITDANGKITSSSTINTTELGYLNGVSSNIQSQLNGLNADFQDFTSHVDSSFAPSSHAVASTTYGLGTTGVYGHVKISNGDVATIASANGLAAGMDHSHSNYLNIVYKDIIETIDPDNYGSSIGSIKYTSFIGVYDSTSTSNKRQVIGDIRLGNLGENYIPRFEMKFDESTVGIPHFITFHTCSGYSKSACLKISGDKVKTNNYARIEYKSQTSIATPRTQTGMTFSEITGRKISATTYHDTLSFSNTIYIPVYPGGSPTSVTFMIKYFPDAGNYANSSTSYASQAGVLSIIQL